MKELIIGVIFAVGVIGFLFEKDVITTIFLVLATASSLSYIEKTQHKTLWKPKQ